MTNTSLTNKNYCSLNFVKIQTIGLKFTPSLHLPVSQSIFCQNETALRDEAGQPITLTGPQIKVEELVPLIPRNAYRKVQLGAQDYWCVTRSLQVPGLGKVPDCHQF